MQKTSLPIGFAEKVNVNVSSERVAEKANVISELGKKMSDDRSDSVVKGKKSGLVDDLGTTKVGQEKTSKKSLEKAQDDDGASREFLLMKPPNFGREIYNRRPVKVICIVRSAVGNG